MKIFMFSHASGRYFIEEYCSSKIIIAENKEAAIVEIFDALHYGKEGRYNEEGDDFPSQLDYYGEGSRESWKKDFIDYLTSIIEGSDELNEVIGVEVSSESRPGIYRDGKYWEYERD